MASIVQRNNRYCVVYLYDDETSGRRRQKWESFRTMADAKKRKAEIEYRQELGTLVIHKCQTIDELLNEYVALYGKATWSISMYTSNTCCAVWQGDLVHFHVYQQHSTHEALHFPDYREHETE